MKLKLATLFTSMVMVNAVSAATIIDLHKQPASVLQKFISSPAFAANATQLKPIRTDIDFNKTVHARLQQMYSGYQVWGATAILHTPQTNTTQVQSLVANAKTRMDGKLVEGLEKDLASQVVNESQKAKALAFAKTTFANKTNQLTSNIKEESVKTIVFVNEKNQARYAFLTSFYADDGEAGAHRPMMIMDATTLEVYRSWDAVLNARHHHARNANDLSPTIAGGVGGNEKAGENVYDNDSGHLPALSMQSMEQEFEILPGQKIKVPVCFLENDDVVVLDVPYEEQVVGNVCVAFKSIPWLSPDKNNTRWNDDQINGGYSPSLDAFYTGNVVQKLYRDWYGIPALTLEDQVTPMQLIMRVHYGRRYDNAFWDGKQMTFGDGGRLFYPLVSLDVAAHEVSHGFTQQHSNIDLSNNQMAALHEAFSDMAGVAAMFYSTNKISWEMGSSIMKGDGALRYLDKPTKDGRSIDNMADYDNTIDAHLACGIFNKAFYLIATSKGWDIHKAFNVMVKANMNYWSPSTATLGEAACGVVKATQDYQYNTDAVKVAFVKVGIDTDRC